MKKILNYTYKEITIDNEQAVIVLTDCKTITKEISFDNIEKIIVNYDTFGRGWYIRIGRLNIKTFQGEIFELAISEIDEFLKFPPAQTEVTYPNERFLNFFKKN